jgi:RES domain-containing protein
MRYDESLLLHFLSQLPRDTDEAAWLARDHNDKVEGRTAFDFAPGRPLRHALEVRDPSFVDAGFIAMLRELDIALVVADTGGRWPEYADLTSDFVYVRLHGARKLYASRYSHDELNGWAALVDRWVRVSDRDAFATARRLTREEGILAGESCGTAVVYASLTKSLAALESLVHLNPPLRFKFLVFRIRFDDAWVERFPVKRLPRNWRVEPPPPSTQQIGDRWVREARSAILALPSVIIPGEPNFLLNPAHPDFKKISVGKPDPFVFDPRLLT